MKARPGGFVIVLATFVAASAAAAPPIVAGALAGKQEAELFPSDPAPGKRFGVALSLSGDTALIGSLGAAYVFVRSGSTWTQQAKLVVAGEPSLGLSVSLSGDTAAVAGSAVGQSTPVYVFVRNGSSWAQQAKLTNSDARFGADVSVSGDTLAVGAPSALTNVLEAGRVHIYARTGTVWSEEAVFAGEAHERLGNAVSVSGDTIAAGASGSDGTTSYGTGFVYVFTRNGPTWVQQAKITPADAAAGLAFGTSVRLSGDTFVALTSSGLSARVFERSGGVWTQTGWLGVDTGWLSYAYIDISADTFVVGAPYWDPFLGPYTGGAQVARRIGSTWDYQATLVGSGSVAGDNVGAGVGVDGDTVVVGAPGKNGNAGAAYVFALKTAAGDPCSDFDQCASGLCVDGVCCDSPCGGGVETDCQACSVAAGAAMNGVCGPVADGIGCNDGDACTQIDSCQGGACSGDNPILCPAGDSCHPIGVCDPMTGACSAPASPDGAGCDDGNACTQADRCEAGVCVGGSPVSCPEADECHEAGSCDPATGTCSHPPKADGTPCSAGTCEAGACAGSSGNSGGSGGSSGFGGSGGSGGMTTSKEVWGAGGDCACRAAGRGADDTAAWLGVLGLAACASRRRHAGTFN